MSPCSEALAVLLVEVEAGLAARVEALLSPCHQRIAVRTISLAGAARSGPGDAAVVVAVAGTTPLDEDPGPLSLLDFHPNVPVVVVAALDDDDAALTALRRHAAGYLLADITAEELLAALTKVASGQTVLDLTIGGRIASRLAQGPRPEQPRLDDWDLRPREREVLEALLEGQTNREIAAQLHLGEETVKTYLRGVYRALGARDRAQAIAIALRRG